MNSSPLTVIPILLSIAAAVLALAMCFLVLWQDAKNRTNQLLGAYMLVITLWGFGFVTYRLTQGIPSLFAIPAWCFANSNFLLFALVTHYLGLWSLRLVRGVLVLGFCYYVLLLPFLLNNNVLFAPPIITPTGRIVNNSTVGYMHVYAVVLFSLVTVALLWHFRHGKGRDLLKAVFFVPIGPIAILIPPIAPLQFQIGAAALASVLVTRAILRENLFNPLAQSEAHYRRLSEELARSEKLYRTLMAQLPNISVFLFDKSLNSLAAEGELLQTPVFQDARQPGSENLNDLLPAALYEADRYSAVFDGKDSQFQQTLAERDYQVQIVAVEDEQGQAFAGMAVISDISELKQAERQALELALEKERVYILKQFISNATHDLMTPLTQIQLSVQLLQRYLAGHSTETRINNLQKQVARLIDLLKDIFDVLRLDDLHHLTLKPHNLRLLLETIVHEHQANAALRQQKLVIEAQELPPVPINAEQFQRAISNIVTNAINYTPVGGTIRVSLEQDKQQAIVKVMDTGIGIAKEDIPHIFQRFYRVDKARSTDSGGTGLGLTIAKRIIELHDGEIIVESELGKGTCVAIAVPV